MNQIIYIYLSGVILNILIGLMQSREKSMHEFMKEDALFTIGTAIFSFLMTASYILLFLLDAIHAKDSSKLK